MEWRVSGSVDVVGMSWGLSQEACPQFVRVWEWFVVLGAELVVIVM